MNRTHTVLIVAASLILVFTARGHAPLRHEDLPRVDTLNFRAKGLMPDTAFAVFLTGAGEAPFGTADYIGELHTNEEGRASLRVDGVIDGRQNLNHAVLHLSNSVADDICFTPVTGAISLADGVGTASMATIFISDSRSTGDSASLFHTIHWRFIKCGSTF